MRVLKFLVVVAALVQVQVQVQVQIQVLVLVGLSSLKMRIYRRLIPGSRCRRRLLLRGEGVLVDLFNRYCIYYILYTYLSLVIVHT